jgi:hypothetical protein
MLPLARIGSQLQHTEKHTKEKQHLCQPLIDQKSTINYAA